MAIEFDHTLTAFLSSWPIERIKKMSINEYADLSNHDSFCYWLEYGSKDLGEIGAVALNKFELWKIKETKDFPGNIFLTDGIFAWYKKKGKSAQEAFEEIKHIILEIAIHAQEGDIDEIEKIKFHSIGKWKIAFMYSNKQILPIYSNRALSAIAKGLGVTPYINLSVLELQKNILKLKLPKEDIIDFAHRIYAEYATKEKNRNYYIIGSKYGDGKGHDKISKISDFINHKCVSIGFLHNLDFSSYIGSEKPKIASFIKDNCEKEEISWEKLQRYFYLLSEIKEGDIIAVKSHGTHNKLTIIAYAEVVSKNGSIYMHQPDDLGHCIHVDFLEVNFNKPTGLTYAETLHQLTTKKNYAHLQKVFGKYVEMDDLENEYQIELDNDITIGSSTREKSEVPFIRSGTASTKVNLIHNRIQNNFVKYLRITNTDSQNEIEWNRIDVIQITDTEMILYEVKPYESVLLCIREGIGQLIDYYHKRKTNKSKRIVIVGINKPTIDDLNFINVIKDNLSIPFSYIAFNESKFSIQEY